MWIPIYWLYLWQIKEYRVSRMVSHLRLLSVNDKVRLFLWGQWRRPHFTPKLLLISGISIGISLVFISIVGTFTSWQVAPLLMVVVAIWLISPLLITCAVGAVAIIERPIKQRVITQAYKKSQTFFDKTTVIGITGSYGKTTTKEFLVSILSANRDVQATPEHVNQTLPMAQFINNLEVAPEILIVEYASYGIGNIAYDTSHVVRPDWAIMTGIAPQHLELFGSLDNIVIAKLELVESVDADAPVFYNADDRRLEQAIASLQRENTTAYYQSDIKPYLEKLSWKDTLKGKLLERMFGTNLAAAISVAKNCGLDDEEITAGMENIDWLPRTLQYQRIGEIDIIDDSYSSNPYGFDRLITFANEQSYKNKILVTSGVIELGEESFSVNNDLSKKAQEVFDHIIITSSSLAPAWKTDTEEVFHAAPEDINLFLKNHVTSDTLLIIEGRIPEMIRQYILNSLSQDIG